MRNTVRQKRVKKARVIPGFRCTFGIVVLMLSLIVLIPLASVLVYSLNISPGEFFSLLNFQYNLFLIALRDDYAGKKQCSELYQNKDT